VSSVSTTAEHPLQRPADAASSPAKRAHMLGRPAPPASARCQAVVAAPEGGLHRVTVGVPAFNTLFWSMSTVAGGRRTSAVPD
jgi:hypothetical protein